MQTGNTLGIILETTDTTVTRCGAQSKKNKKNASAVESKQTIKTRLIKNQYLQVYSLLKVASIIRHMFTNTEPLNKHTNEKKSPIKSRMCKVTAAAALQYIQVCGPSCLCVSAAHQKTLSTDINTDLERGGVCGGRT